MLAISSWHSVGNFRIARYAEQRQEMLSLRLDKSINLGDAPFLGGLEGQTGCGVIEAPCDATPSECFGA